jgi:hypothetical protein
MLRRLRLSSLLIASQLALLQTAGVAGANGRFPLADLIVFDPEDPDRFVVRTTFGLLETTDSGASFNWICEAALELQGQEDPMIAITGGGVILASTSDGIVVEPRDQCGFQHAPELKGLPIPDLALDRSDPVRALAFSASSELWLTEDEGQSFSQIGEPMPSGWVPLSIDVAPSDSNRVYITARLPAEENYASTLLRSDDGGESFDSFPIEGTSAAGFAFIAAVGVRDPDRIYVRISSGLGTRVITSDDGGESFTTVMVGIGDILGFAVSPDGESVALGGPADGLWVGSSAGLDLEQRSALPVSCLGWTTRGLYACSQEAAPFNVGVSRDDGSTFDSLLRFKELCGQTTCAAGTNLGDVCPAEWSQVGPSLGATCNVSPSSGGSGAGGGAGSGADTGDTGGSPSAERSDAGGCSVAHAGPMNGASQLSLLAWLALGLRSRRRFAPRGERASHARATPRGGLHSM